MLPPDGAVRCSHPWEIWQFVSQANNRATVRFQVILTWVLVISFGIRGKYVLSRCVDTLLVLHGCRFSCKFSGQTFRQRRIMWYFLLLSFYDLKWLYFDGRFCSLLWPHDVVCEVYLGRWPPVAFMHETQRLLMSNLGSGRSSRQ